MTFFRTAAHALPRANLHSETQPTVGAGALIATQAKADFHPKASWANEGASTTKLSGANAEVISANQNVAPICVPRPMARPTPRLPPASASGARFQMRSTG